VLFARAAEYLAPLARLRERSFGHLHAYHLRLRALLLEHPYRYDAYSGLANARIELKPHLGRIGHITLGVVPWSGQKPRTLSRRSRKPVIARSIYPCWCELPRT